MAGLSFIFVSLLFNLQLLKAPKNHPTWVAAFFQQEVDIPSWCSTIRQMKDQLEETENRLICRREELGRIRDDRYRSIFEQREQISPGISNTTFKKKSYSSTLLCLLKSNSNNNLHKNWIQYNTTEWAWIPKIGIQNTLEYKTHWNIERFEVQISNISGLEWLVIVMVVYMSRKWGVTQP